MRGCPSGSISFRVVRVGGGINKELKRCVFFLSATLSVGPV